MVKAGEIVERGTHKELVDAGGVYTELYETQFKSGMPEKENELSPWGDEDGIPVWNGMDGRYGRKSTEYGYPWDGAAYPSENMPIGDDPWTEQPDERELEARRRADEERQKILDEMLQPYWHI